MIKKILAAGLGNISLGLKNILYEPSCVLCRNPLVFSGEKLVCEDCLDTLNLYNSNYCVKCGKYITVNRLLCGECVLHPPRYKRHLSYTTYDRKMKELIILYKYGEIIPLKKILASFLVTLYRTRVKESFDYLVPVPPDKARHGFFYPLGEIARILARKLNIPLMNNNLIKIKHTEPQATLTRSKRINNLNGAFILRFPHRFQKKKLLLIDDVYTTGTTIRQCLKPLLKEKAVVTAITLARSV